MGQHILKYVCFFTSNLCVLLQCICVVYSKFEGSLRYGMLNGAGGCISCKQSEHTSNNEYTRVHFIGPL